MTRAAPLPRDAGLTLIELLVAMAIFAVIGVAGLAVLDTVLNVNARTDGRLERLAQVDRALLVVRRDLAQAQPTGLTLDGTELRFVRAEGADAVQEMTVVLDDSRLIRSLPRGGAAPLDQVLLTGVEALNWRMLDAGRTWHETWEGGGDAALAAELTLTFSQDGGAAQVTRLMALPSAVRR